MLNRNDQEIRCYVDSLLQIMKDGVAPPVLKSYKKKSTNHMRDIQADLATCTHDFAPATFQNDEALTNSLDIYYWLHLLRQQMQKGQLHLGNGTHKHIDTMRELRNTWAHQGVITCEAAQRAAEAGHKLLTALGANQEAKNIQDTVKQLLLIAQTTDGDTELVQPIKESASYYIEIIGQNGLATSECIPLNKDRMLIGRSLSSHIRITDDARVSRAHLLITRQKADEIKLTDLRSANGTVIEEQLLPPNTAIKWPLGRRITIGSTWLILRRGS